MLHVVIMAGGSGTRFWPESRADHPKQLMSLTGDKTMLQETVARLEGLVPPERTLILANVRLAEQISRQLPNVPSHAIVCEPCKRDTAPCIGLAALLLLKHDPEAIMAVMPSDHVIRPAATFRRTLQEAASLVENNPNRIVTFGIRPTYPAESFGYIERGAALANHPAAYHVARFREKPKGDLAKQFCDSGNFYWNSGIFVWRAKTIADELQARRPEMMGHLSRIAEAWGTPQAQTVFEKQFAVIQGISIDYAVMEHAKDVVVIEAPFEWDDVGSWRSLERIIKSDADGNTVTGKHLGLNTSGSIIRGGDGHLIVTLGLKDCLVVHTPDATLVADKHDEESIRQLVKILEERGWKEYL